jgi:hypothetical protein
MFMWLRSPVAALPPSKGAPLAIPKPKSMYIADDLNHGSDEDVFAAVGFATPNDLRKIADDWERTACSVATDCIAQSKCEAADLGGGLDAAINAEDEEQVRKLYIAHARQMLGIVTKREIRAAIARAVGGQGNYTNAMRCVLDAMV